MTTTNGVYETTREDSAVLQYGGAGGKGGSKFVDYFDSPEGGAVCQSR